ncbi:hypothetical protein BKA62DRAFT_700647, partial [Auriculariales sp. MPI-PUGE-AT-0066]
MRLRHHRRLLVLARRCVAWLCFAAESSWRYHLLNTHPRCRPYPALNRRLSLQHRQSETRHYLIPSCGYAAVYGRSRGSSSDALREKECKLTNEKGHQAARRCWQPPHFSNYRRVCTSTGRSARPGQVTYCGHSRVQSID